MKKKITLVLSLGLILTGCQNDPSQTELKQRELEQIQVDLRALKPEQTCSADTQCSLLGVGGSICGGAGSYLPLSIMSPNKVAAENLAQRHVALSLELIPAEAFRTCAKVAPPTVACMDSKCVVTSPNYVPPF